MNLADSKRKITTKRIIKINAITQAQLIKLLLDGVYNCQELADQTGLSYVTVLHYTRELHRAGAAHICAWEKDRFGREKIKIYKIGEKADAKNKTLTPAQRQARYKARKHNRDMMQRLVLEGKEYGMVC